MEREAIDRIIQLAEQRPLNMHIPGAILPEGMAVQSLEEFMEFPARQRVHFQTQRILDFVTYVRAEAEPGVSAVFVRPNGGTAEAIIDFGTNVSPGWKKHRASLCMQRTAEFEALADACDSPLTQRELINLLEDWPETLQGVDADNRFIEAPVLIQTLRKVDIKATLAKGHEEQDFRTSVSSLEEVEAKAGAGDLPRCLCAHIPVYHGTRHRGMQARLSLRTSGDKPAFQLRLVGREALMEDVAQEVQEVLATELAGVARVFVGMTD